MFYFYGIASMNKHRFVMYNNRKTIQPINIDVIEKHFNVTFVGDFAVKTTDGNWSDFPVAVFYQSNPDIDKGHSHYLGAFYRNGDLVIIDAASAFSKPITGLTADNGEVIFSRYRHDYHTSIDNSVSIDGGRDYCRMRCANLQNEKHRIVELVIDKDQLVIHQIKKRTKLNP